MQNTDEATRQHGALRHDADGIHRVDSARLRVGREEVVIGSLNEVEHG